MKKTLAAFAAAALALGFAQTKPAPSPGPNNKEAVEQFARYLYVWGPHIQVTVGEAHPSVVPGLFDVVVTASANGITEPHTFRLTPDGQHIFETTIYGIDNPFAEQLAKLKTDLAPTLGTAGAPVTIVLFSDFQCAYCRQLEQQLMPNLLKTYPKEVRLYFKDFPLEQIHPWSRLAAIAGRCVFRQDPAAFWAFHDWVFEKQPDLTPEKLRTDIMAWATSKSVDTLQLGRCYDDKSTDKDVERTLEEGKALHIQSTPTMFINGRPLPGAYPWASLKTVIDFEIDHQKKLAANEKCCTLQLSPLPAKPSK